MDALVSSLTSKSFIASAILLVAAFVVLGILSRIEKRYLAKEEAVTTKTGAAVRSVFRVMRIVLVVLALLAIFQVNGVNISSLVAGLGIASAIVGLAMQDILKDALMGFHILNDHSFTVGDVVKIGDDEGLVTDFTLLTTKFRSINTDDEVVLCNRNITQVARSAHGRYLTVLVPLAEDPNRVQEALDRAATYAAGEGPVRSARNLGFKGYDEGRMAYGFYYSCDPATHWPAERVAWQAIRRALEEAEIRPPMPQISISSISS